jgi:hypothetical protein
MGNGGLPFLRDLAYDRQPNQYSFFESYGFSVEMWQEAPDSEVELVTRSIRIGQQEPYNWSAFGYQNRFEFNVYATDSGAFGGDTDPNNEATFQSYEGKIEVFAYYNCPTFHSRKFTLRFLVSQQSWYWKKEEVTYTDPQTGQTNTYVYYQKVFNPMSYSIRTATFNTADSSYSSTVPWKVAETTYTAGPRTVIGISAVASSFE